MKEALKNTCTFSRIWDHVDSIPGYGVHPASELCYCRAYFNSDGCRWYNSWHTMHQDLQSPELVKELDQLYSDFTDDFPNLNVLRQFCESSCERTEDPGKFVAYMELDHGLYEFCFCTRPRDYNLRMHVYSKKAVEMCADCE